MEAAAQRVKLGQMLVKSPFSFLVPLPSFLLSQCCSVDHRARCWLIEDVVSVCPPSFNPPRLRCSLSQMVSCRRTMTLSWVFTMRRHRAMFSSSPCSPKMRLKKPLSVCILIPNGAVSRGVNMALEEEWGSRKGKCPQQRRLSIF